MADQTNPSTPNPIKNGDHPSTSVGNNANQSLIGSQNTSNVPIQIPLNVAILAPTQNVAAALPPRPTSIVSNLRKASDISPISSGSPTMNQRGRPVTGEGRNVSWGEQPEALQAEIEIEFQKQAERQHRYQGMSEPTASLNLNDDQAALNLNQDMSRNYSKSQSFNSPFLNDDNDEELDQFLENNANVPQRSDSTKPSMIQSRQQSLRLDDVLKTNPLETEAETLILNAIEARERASTASSLLNNVTSEGASVFNTVRGKSGSIGSQSEVDKRNTISGNVDDHDVKSSLSNTNSANDPNQAANHIRNLSKDSMSTKGSMRGDLSGLRKRTFSKESVSTRGELSPGILGRGTTSGTSTSHSIPMDHRRMHTMEQTLAGLMDAITGIHDVEDGNRNSAYHQPEETLIGGEKTMGVAGTLAQNANLIYRGNKPPKLQSQPSIKHIQTNSFDSSTPTAAAHWGTLKQAVHSSSFEAMEKLKKSEITSDEEAGQRKDKYFEENGEPPQPMASSPNSYPMDDHDKAQGGGTTRKKRFVGRFVDTAKQTNGALSDFCIFMVERQASLLIYIRVLIGLIGPALGVAFFLFYAADNPPTGRVDFEATAASNGTLTNHLGKPIDKDAASISWWILFICVRQVFTFSVSKALEVFIIDFLCLSTRVMVTIFGNLLTLFIVQSKGWPFLLLMWSVLNAGLLHGQNKFVKHWLYWQDPISIFNEENPSGNITSNEWHRKALIIVSIVSVLVALKRLWLGLFLGQKTYANYAEELAKVMNKILCLCQVAALARDFQWEVDNLSRNQPITRNCGMSLEKFNGLVQSTAGLYDEGHDNFNNTEESAPTRNGIGFLIDPNEIDRQTGTLSQSEKIRLIDLLGAWEGPEEEMSVEENPSISAILQFRNSLSLLDNRYMFSIGWGDVSWRDRMVISSQDVYRRLMIRTPNAEELGFDIMAQTAMGSNGSLDKTKLKDLIRLFRPDRDGTLSLLQFVKSVDTVYKEAKLLRASVSNSEMIDRTFERAINIVFYTIMTCIILSQIGYDPLALFLSLSSIIVAFAFMIGSASSKIFEGVLFILIRRPFDIGDRIHVSDTETDTSSDGSPGWIVKDVDLFTTTVIYGSTNERATVANSSLAASRIINMARSKKASVTISNKFSTEVPYENILIFEQALREFVQARPREWGRFVAFRAKQVMSDLGYVDYAAVLEHRESWQNIGNILSSKAQVSSFCLEMAKKLGMRYKSPPLPVDLTVNNKMQGMESLINTSVVDPKLVDEVSSMFAIAK